MAVDADVASAATVPPRAQAAAGLVRPGGRPRDARCEAAILSATLDLFSEVGFEGMSIEALAARAGVGKTTIYRRWPSKEAIVVAALSASLSGAESPIDTGSLVGDLAALVKRSYCYLTSTVSGQVMPEMMRHVAADTRLGHLYAQQVLAPKRRRMLEMFERALVRGELRAGIDVAAAADTVTGTLMYLRLSRRIFDLDEAAVVRTIGQVLDGIRTPVGDGAAPERRARVERRAGAGEIPGAEGVAGIESCCGEDGVRPVTGIRGLPAEQGAEETG